MLEGRAGLGRPSPRDPPPSASTLATPPLGALAERAGWEAFWLTAAILAAVGAAVAARIPVLRPGSVSAPE